MKVILVSDVKKVGKKGQIVDVADGYARNFLIRNGFAVQATETSQQILKNQKIQAAENEKEAEENAKALAEKLKNMTIEFRVKAGKEGKVFGSVSTKQIAEKLQQQHGIKVDKRKFVDSNPISMLGITNCKIELHKNVIGTIKVKLVEE